MMDLHKLFAYWTNHANQNEESEMEKFFTRMTGIYLGMLCVAGILILLGMNTVIQTYLINERTDMLMNQAMSLEKVYQKIYDPKVTNDLRFKAELVAYERYSGAKIAVVSRNGLVHSSNEESPKFFEESEVNAKQLESVFRGIVLKKEVNAYNINGSRMIALGYPVEIEADYPFAIFLFLPIPEIQRTAFGLALIIFVSLISVGIAAFFLLYQSTKRINRDILRLSEAAKRMAAGNFESRIDQDSRSELAVLAESFNHMANELQQAEGNKRQFISNISHDLRSPLTSINGYARAILDGTIPESRKDHTLQIILDESQRLTKMTIDMIDLTKLQSGYLPVKSTSFDINQLLLHELDKFENRILEKHIEIELALINENLNVFADYEAITRVIYNLLDNAIKFVDVGETVTIHSTSFRDKVWVTIQNSTPDIPEEQIELIWKRFTKLDKSRGQERHSSGLGLAIVKEIIKSHDEVIEVSSGTGQGVTFSFSLTPTKEIRI